MPDLPDDFSMNKKEIAATVAALGGVSALQNSHWFLKLIGRALKAYHENGNADYFKTKYPRMANDAIAAKMINVAAKNASLVGAASGAAMTGSEFAVVATVGAGVPVAVAGAVTSVAVDVVGSTAIQLKLIASLASLYGKPLDPDDPEDVLLVIEFFLGAKLVDSTGLFTAKAGGKLAGVATKKLFSGERLKTLQKLGGKVQMKILQKTAVSKAIPIASIGLGAGFNYYTTKGMGKIAKATMKKRAAEQSG